MDPEYFSDNRLSLVANENCKIRACKPPRIEEFPPDLFTQEQRYYGGVAFHFLICLHIFCALTVVCDDYFVSSLTRITKCLKLKPDVAGATFMAVGSSAPTLFISIISTFFTEGDIGLGTIVGSTIFNTLFIIALCGIGAGVTMHLTWYPIFRDSIMYILSVLILMFSLYDRKIHWYESVALFVAYTLYIIVMYFNDSLEEWAQEMKEKITKREEEKESKRIEIEYEEVQDINESTENLHESEETENRLKLPKGSVFSKALWIFTLPSIILFFFTIPDCRKKKWQKFYLLTFTSSAIWMGGLSYVLVWMVSLVGYTYNIPECVLGMTFLAAGSSLPDAIASLVVAKLGRGDMAVSNCIGSNVFDMLCLGITWLIKTTIVSPNTAVYIQSENIFFTSGILIASILCTILLIVLNKWKLDEKLGVIFLVMRHLKELDDKLKDSKMTQKFPRRISVLHHRKRHFFNCSSHAIIEVLQYQTIFSLQQRREGAIVIHGLICLYCFGALAILCDHYFCASLEKICKRLRIPTDVAGATFMAAGSSMPTLFIAIASVFMGEGDIGLGTIIGSTMFNILFISAICGLCSGMAIALHTWPLLRDSLAYTVHLIALLIAIEDNTVHWYEAAVFPFLYCGYILIMCYNKKLEGLFEKCCQRFCEIRKGFEMVQMDDPGENDSKSLGDDNTTAKSEQDIEENPDTAGHNKTKESHALESPPSQVHGFSAKSPLEIPKSSCRLVIWIIMLPIHAIFFITMPDCRKKGWESWYPVTFVVSIIWMAIISYVLVWTVSVIGETFDIPECIMGLTLLAAGSSVPDAMASLVVAKHGMGDMALANCVGSNIFDILCLGLPWFLAATVVHPGSVVLIHSGHIVYTSLCLFGTVLVTLIVIHLNNWYLDKRGGCILLIIYLIFLTVAVILEALPRGNAPKLSPHHPSHLPKKGLGHHRNGHLTHLKKVT